MNSILRNVAAVMVLGCGASGFLAENRISTGRLVSSATERAAIRGAACFGQETSMKYICSGGLDSDCSGCGCQMEHPPKDEDQGYAKPDANCKDSPTCVYPFRRGSCKGE